MKRIILMLMIVVMLTGCGGGGGTTSTDTSTPIGTPVNLQTIKAVYEGSDPSTAYSAILSGSDNTGTKYSGTIVFTGKGLTSFESKLVTESYITMSLTNLSTRETNIGDVSSYYLSPTSVFYKSMSSYGTVCTPITTGAPLPLTAVVGDSGESGRTTYGPGITEVSSWALKGGTDGNAKIIFASSIQYADGSLQSTEYDTFYISPSGALYQYDAEIIRGGSSLKLSGSLKTVRL